MSSSCLSGSSRAYSIDLDIVKSPTTTFVRNSPTSSSPISTVSDSGNSPLSISTRKPRTRRKRPNHTYNEAAALLSAACPAIFPAEHLADTLNPRRPRRVHSPDDSSQLFLPFRVDRDDESVFLLHHPPGEETKPCFFQIETKFSPSSDRSKAASYDHDYEENFEAESILDGEIEEGIIDSIMGEKSSVSQGTESLEAENKVVKSRPSWSRNPAGRLDIFYGFRRTGVSAWRDVGEVNWWNFPTVDVDAISPKLNPHRALNTNSAADKKKKKKKVDKHRPPVPSLEDDIQRISNSELVTAKEGSHSHPVTLMTGAKKAGLLLKLDYNNVLDAWSGLGSPFPDDSPATEVPGNDDVAGGLAQIDLFGEGAGTREASVLRYKEKRRTRLFSKKIRYQVRKLNADCRPRMKGRFVRRPSSKLIKDVEDHRIGTGNVPKPFRKK